VRLIRRRKPLIRYLPRGRLDDELELDEELSSLDEEEEPSSLEDDELSSLEDEELSSLEDEELSLADDELSSLDEEEELSSLDDEEPGALRFSAGASFSLPTAPPMVAETKKSSAS
jgi:hypothetical protein